MATLSIEMNAEPPGSPSTGDLLHERYRLLRPIGAGAMGVVWLARDELLRRRVAVKVLRDGSDSGATGRLSDGTSGGRAGVLRHLREARTAAALSHPNVTAVFDVGEQDGHAYIVMEFVEGLTLQELLVRGPLPEAEAGQIGAALAGALAAAHRAGVVHLDVKPANVIVSSAGAVKLTDLGIASDVGGPPEAAADHSTASKAGTAVYGTLPYVAPERLRGGEAGPPADVYAVGVVLYEMVAGHQPFDVTSADALRHAQEAAPPPFEAHDPALVDACRQAMALEPEQRPSAAVLAAMLGGGALDTPTELVRPVPVVPEALADEASHTAVLVPESEAGTERVAATASLGGTRRALVAIALAGASIAAAVGIVGALHGARGPSNAPTSPPTVVISSPTHTPAPTPSNQGHHGHGHHHHHGHGGG